MVVEICPNISVIIININKLNSPITIEELLDFFKDNNPLKR